jgi:hypothetical protein
VPFSARYFSHEETGQKCLKRGPLYVLHVSQQFSFQLALTTVGHWDSRINAKIRPACKIIDLEGRSRPQIQVKGGALGERVRAFELSVQPGHGITVQIEVKSAPNSPPSIDGSQNGPPSLRYFGLPPAQPRRLGLVDPTDRYLRAWKPVPSCLQFDQQRVHSRFFSLLLPLSNGHLLHYHGETKSHG